MLQPYLNIQRTPSMGRGVFTNTDIPAGTVIEIAPVIVMPQRDRPVIDQTLLHDYIFEWGPSRKECAMALGYVPIYNHSYAANCEYAMDYDEETITVTTTREISAGEELFINYNGDWDNRNPVWFETNQL